MNMTIDSPASVEELAKVYVQAWNDHDLDRILEFHPPDMKFVMHGADGVQIREGIDDCRDTFGFLLALLPDQYIQTQTLVVKKNFYVGHSTIAGTPALP